MESVNNSVVYAILGDKQWARDWGGQSEKDVKPYVVAEEAGGGRPGRGQRYYLGLLQEHLSLCAWHGVSPSQPVHMHCISTTILHSFLVVCKLGLQAGSRTKPVVQSRSGLGRLGVLVRLTAPSSNMEYGSHSLASSAVFGP